MKRIFMISFCLTLFGSSFGQDSKLEGIFAFVYASGSLPTANASLTNPYIQKVFDDLVEAKGVKSILPPKLIISNSESVAAWAQPETQTIGLELKAIEICRSFGKDSLNAYAGLLAHELTHYYEKHDWSNHFIRNYTSIAEDNPIDPNAGKQMEMEADDLGGLLAHMAGYKSLNVMADLLTKIYKGYNLDPEVSDNYPNLASRIEMANMSRDHLSALIPLFEVANYMMITGQESIAAEYLEYIVNKSGFVSREIQNNLGALYAIQAYDLRPRQELKILFPFHIDTDSRLGTRGSKDVTFEQQYAKAIYYLESAISLDGDYFPAYVNLACLHIIKGDFKEADFLIYRIEKQGADEHLINLLKGILEVYSSNVEKAMHYFDLAASSNVIARKNLSILKGEKVSKQMLVQPMPILDEVDLNKLYARIVNEEISPSSSLDLNKTSAFYAVNMENSEVYIHMDYNTEESFSFFHVIDQNDDLLPVKIGETEEDLIEYFGLPDIAFGSKNQSIYNYKNLSLIAVIKHVIVEKWCIYKQNLK